MLRRSIPWPGSRVFPGSAQRVIFPGSVGVVFPASKL